MIRQIAQILNVHPQTLRLYERHGLITPARTQGNTRLYSWQDVQYIRTILHLTRDLGVNLAGVDIILSMQRKIAALQRDIDALQQAVPPDHTMTSPQRALTKTAVRTLVRVQRRSP
jgi:MerR family transcriptional regulator/heat shock protein HspR